jgi:integrase
MRFSMGIQKNEHGVYFVRRKVPKGLQEAAAKVLGNGKARQTFLQKSLETKDSAAAKRKAPAVLMEFDGVLARARVLAADQPIRDNLSQAEIERMGDARQLIRDEDFVRRGPENEQEFRNYEELAAKEGLIDEVPVWDYPVPKYGLSEADMADASVSIPEMLRAAEAALARGGIDHAEFHIESILEAFYVRLDHDCEAYRRLGMEILRQDVRALRAMQQRGTGEPIPSPKLPIVGTQAVASGDTLQAAFAGWKKARNPAPGTLAEYDRAVRLFTELHGDMPVASIGRRHARTFVEALQDVPRKRTGKLLEAKLPELAEWGREHPAAQRLSEGTINKLVGGVQAVSVWARDNGLVPDDVPWADPFARMRLEEDEPDREPFTIAELNTFFASPVYAEGSRPNAGQGETAYWLPLLALFSGARRGELAGLTVADVCKEPGAGGWVLTFSADRKRGKKLKNKQSARIVPLHPELERLGFLRFVEGVKSRAGANAWLFKPISPEVKDGAKAWTKWFGRYLHSIVTDARKVFHSFRHNFIDALRSAGVDDELRKALAGHSAGSVHGGYGAKEMILRWGPQLRRAVASVRYPKLDLSHLIKQRAPRGRKAPR